MWLVGSSLPDDQSIDQPLWFFAQWSLLAMDKLKIYFAFIFVSFKCFSIPQNFFFLDIPRRKGNCHSYHFLLSQNDFVIKLLPRAQAGEKCFATVCNISPFRNFLKNGLTPALSTTPIYCLVCSFTGKCRSKNYSHLMFAFSRIVVQNRKIMFGQGNIYVDFFKKWASQL